MVREYVWLECGDSGQRNYRTPKETRGTERLELKKYCKKLRRHTIHKESRKKWPAAAVARAGIRMSRCSRICLLMPGFPDCYIFRGGQDFAGGFLSVFSGMVSLGGFLRGAGIG